MILDYLRIAVNVLPVFLLYTLEIPTKVDGT